MAAHTITGTITQTVYLGQPGYASPLTISPTGVIAPTTYSGAGIIDPASLQNGRIDNQGKVSGAYGGKSGGEGGIGINLLSTGTLINSGTINGGTGGYADEAPSGAGGIGVDLTAGGRIDNTGTINGGAGGYSSGNDPHFGYGGVGVQLQGGLLNNAGTITGGPAAYGGEHGSGTSAGGAVAATDGAVIVNTGRLAGGQGAYGADFGSSGGSGIQLSDASLTNRGSITGGGGGSGYFGGGASGGTGAVVLKNASLTNSLTITGGNGGYGHFDGGSGGNGAFVYAGTIKNTGTISGGNGGGGSESYGGYGGAGVDVSSGTLIAGGTISGGSGGLGGFQHAGGGGAGIYFNGGTVIATGKISGGTGYVNGDAVQFGTLAGTLVIDPGTIFNGLVAANSTVNDELLLTGKGGTLSGLGTEFTGFTTIAERPGADWTISGASTLATGATLIVREFSSLTLQAALSGDADIRINTNATLTAYAGISAATLRFANGGHETLILNSTDAVTGTISGFRPTDTIDLASTLTSLSVMNSPTTSTLTLFDGTTAIETFTLAGHLTAADFSLTPDGHGGTDITIATPTANSTAHQPASALLHETPTLLPFAPHPHTS